VLFLVVKNFQRLESGFLLLEEWLASAPGTHVL